MAWSDLVTNADDMDRFRDAQDAVDRAIGAGAQPPLTYRGTGMTAHVFQDASGAAFKVGRRDITSGEISPTIRRMLADEAAWLKTAGRAKATRGMVPQVYRFDPANVVIVRAFASGVLGFGKHPKTYDYMDQRAQKKHEELEQAMLRRGWTAPEYKPESWAFDPEDPNRAQIFDAGFVNKVGRRLVAHALQQIRDGASREDLNDTMRAIRNEATHWKSPTISIPTARKVLSALVKAGGDPQLAREMIGEKKENPRGDRFEFGPYWDRLFKKLHGQGKTLLYRHDNGTDERVTWDVLMQDVNFWTKYADPKMFRVVKRNENARENPAGGPYQVFPGFPITVQKLSYSRSPWRVLAHGKEIEFAHFNTKKEAMEWAQTILSLPWSMSIEEWSPDSRLLFGERLRATPGYASWVAAMGRSAEIAREHLPAPVATPAPLPAPPPPAPRREPIRGQIPHVGTPRPLYEVADRSALTFQAHRAEKLRGIVDTKPEFRLSPRLMVSDLGMKMIPDRAKPFLPPGVVSYQVVDAHQGHMEAESELLRQGFGHARSWHYEVLREPEFFRDAEGHVVHRWIRFFGRVREGNRFRHVPWSGDGPATSSPYAMLQQHLWMLKKEAHEERRAPNPRRKRDEAPMSILLRGDRTDRIVEVAQAIVSEQGVGRVRVVRGKTFIELTEVEANEFFVKDLCKEIEKWVGRGVKDYQIYGEYAS